MVESTIAQSTIPASSAALSSRHKIASEVPSALIRRCQVQIVCHGPNTGGTSRHGIPTSVPVNDPLNDLTGIPKRPALLAGTHRQQILDQQPLGIREQLKPRHDLSIKPNTQNTCQTRPSPRLSPSGAVGPRAGRRGLAGILVLAATNSGGYMLRVDET